MRPITSAPVRTAPVPTSPPHRPRGSCRVLAGVTAGAGGLVALLAVLSVTAGLGRLGWVVGLGCGAVLTGLVVRGVHRAGRDVLLPGDVVTFSRALLVCGVAALTVHSLVEQAVPTAILALSAPALALDAVDGRVARRTGTATPFGARLDGEVDAFLILVLSLAVAPMLGWWTLLAGSARYVFAGAGLAFPWLRRPLDARYWRKVVAAVMGITLAAAAADVLPRPLATIGVVVALLLLAESFGRDAWWLWRRRRDLPATRTGRLRAVATGAVVVAALVLVWLALLAPVQPDRVTPLAFLRLPLEALVLVGVAVVLPAGARRVAMTLTGLLIGTLAVAKVLDLGTFGVRGRPFDAVNDLGALRSGVSSVEDSFGTGAALGTVLGAIVLTGAALIGIPWALTWIARRVDGRRRAVAWALAGTTLAWAAAAAGGPRSADDLSVAAADVVPYASAKVRAVDGTLRDRARFDAAVRTDAFGAPGAADLSALRGKDVVIVVVESYGRVAVEGPGSGPVVELLDRYTARLAASGYTARSAFLTSPVVGSGSWMAHATLQSGLRVGDQGRYDRLLSSARTTLTSAFGDAGWRTVAMMPSTHGPWPEGQAFYGLDRLYSASDLGYAGPSFGFSSMPDQYTMAALDRLELGAPRERPVMAEVALTSSHWPWAPRPSLVDPGALGDGVVYGGIRDDAQTAEELWSDRRRVPEAYRRSVEYSLASVFSFIESAPGDLVVLVLGDHQPSSVVTGPDAGRDVPVTLVARDPAVVDRVSPWRWQPGLHPDASAPVWAMESFRDRFLSTFDDPVGGSAARRTRGP
jgi:phosphatidylglycerophosphate synthase